MKSFDSIKYGCLQEDSSYDQLRKQYNDGWKTIQRLQALISIPFKTTEKTLTYFEI